MLRIKIHVEQTNVFTYPSRQRYIVIPRVTRHLPKNKAVKIVAHSVRYNRGVLVNQRAILPREGSIEILDSPPLTIELIGSYDLPNFRGAVIESRGPVESSKRAIHARS